jgi:hypothetical protein
MPDAHEQASKRRQLRTGIRAEHCERAVPCGRRGAIIAREGADVVQRQPARIGQIQAQVCMVREARGDVRIGEAVPARRLHAERRLVELAHHAVLGHEHQPLAERVAQACCLTDAAHPSDHRSIVTAEIVLAHAAVALRKATDVELQIQTAEAGGEGDPSVVDAELRRRIEEARGITDRARCDDDRRHGA